MLEFRSTVDDCQTKAILRCRFISPRTQAHRIATVGDDVPLTFSPVAVASRSAGDTLPCATGRLPRERLTIKIRRRALQISPAEQSITAKPVFGDIDSGIPGCLNAPLHRPEVSALLVKFRLKPLFICRIRTECDCTPFQTQAGLIHRGGAHDAVKKSA